MLGPTLTQLRVINMLVANGEWRVANKKAQVEISTWAFLISSLSDDIFQGLA
jgi:hypothetical protein